MKFNWGWGLVVLYLSFVVLIVVLVVASNRQSVDLVSNDYYGEEIAFQKVIDASKNQSNLSSSFSIQNSSEFVSIKLPSELRKSQLSGNIQFYSPANSKWDYNYTISSSDSIISISKSKLQHTKYTVKINCTANGKNYYQESDLLLQ